MPSLRTPQPEQQPLRHGPRLALWYALRAAVAPVCPCLWARSWHSPRADRSGILNSSIAVRCAQCALRSEYRKRYFKISATKNRTSARKERDTELYH